jgi:dimethylhistidine N-methyltransferase
MNQQKILTKDTDTLNEIYEGLKLPQKFLPSKLFYDEKGSQLFDQICRLDEYYLTRTEMMILKNNIDEIVECFEDNSVFIEYGSGSSLKSRLLLKSIKNISAYVPIDISTEYLQSTVELLNERYPDLDIYPVAADYTKTIQIPEIRKPVNRRTGFFPGSTIGNFLPHEAREFLMVVADELGKNGGLIIGIDLIKDRKILEAAYNDQKGITAEFNFNLLHRLNNEFGFNFNLESFKHSAPFNEDMSRIEMHLVSLHDQTVISGEEEFHFKKWETILTEYSHKYSVDSFEKIIDGFFTIKKIWTDENKYFAVMFLETI